MRSLLVFLLLAPLGAQIPLFREVADLIPGSAGPVLGLADFDQDGDLDLLTNGTGIYLNDGNGKFTPHPVLSPVAAYPYLYANPIAVDTTPLFAIGDLNGDGYPDVIAQSPYPAVLMIKWMNQGNGALLPTSLGAGFNAGFGRAMALGDIDADGDVDVIISRTSGSQLPNMPLLLWLNDGTGSFTAGAPGQLPAAAMTAAQLALADFNGDGYLDLLVGGLLWGPPAPPVLFLNNGSGFFAQAGIPVPAPASLDVFAVRDIGGDGMADVVLDASPSWASCPAATPTPPLVLMSTGAGTFSPVASSITGPLGGGMPRLVDLNADGFQDLVRLTYQGAQAFLLSPSAAGPLVAQPALISGPDDPEFSTYAASSALGDVDGDGDEDIVAFTGQGNQVLFNDSAAAPVVVNDRLSARRRTTQHQYQSGDLDGDGDDDLVLGFFQCVGGGTELQVARNDGRGNLQEGSPLPCPGISVLLGPRAFFDADGDGDLDGVVCVSNQAAQAYVLLQSGGSMVLSQTITFPGAPRCVRSGDLDGDGDLDVVVGLGMTNPKALVFINNGAGGFQAGATLMSSGAGGGCDLVLADLDGDGDLDVATAVQGANTVYLNAGNGTFVSLGFGSLPYYALDYIDAGDLDGDGDVDLILDNMILLNSGTASFSQTGTIPLANWVQGQQGIDFRLVNVDGDGDLDLSDSKGWIYKNAGNATFSAAEALPRKLTVPIVAADFDRDGDQDLIAFGPRILTNMTRQLSRGMPARPGRPASLELGAAPGTPWQLYASTGTTSLPLPPFGTVRLDLAGLQLAASGGIGTSAVSTLTGIVPTTPGIVGTTIYWQAVLYHPSGPRLTGLEVTTVAAF